MLPLIWFENANVSQPPQLLPRTSHRIPLEPLSKVSYRSRPEIRLRARGRITTSGHDRLLLSQIALLTIHPFRIEYEHLTLGILPRIMRELCGASREETQEVSVRHQHDVLFRSTSKELTNPLGAVVEAEDPTASGTASGKFRRRMDLSFSRGPRA